VRVGIVGLPQSGKTTVFNALTGAHGQVGGFHDEQRIDVAVLKVPDERLAFLGGLFEPEKLVAAVIEFEDIAGGFGHVGSGVAKSSQALAAMRGTEALLMVLRCFEDPSVPHVHGDVNPARDLSVMRDELTLADLGVVENRAEAIKRELKRPTADRGELQAEAELLDRCKAALEQGHGVSTVQMTDAEEKMLRSYAFLTLKPALCVLNLGEDQIGHEPRFEELDGLEPEPISMCGKLEMEIMDLDEEDRQLFMEDLGIEELVAGRAVRACYELMGLRSFFTYAGKEVRAWTVKAGDDALTAAGKIHTDMAHGFIRAEVVHFDDLKESGSMQEARAGGKVRLEGKDYEVQDGDVITFRFSP